MFPLGSVLFPGAVLPLQVFEPRFCALIDDVAADDYRFGVVLISRGHEVGGGDVRTDVGTMARVVRRGEAEDGRILVTAVGMERIRVVEWLDDDPYPRALLESIDERPVTAGTADAISAASAARRRLLALAIEMGADGQQLDLDLPEDEIRAAWALCAAAPVGSFDRQRLLELDDIEERLQLLESLLSDQARDLQNALWKL